MILAPENATVADQLRCTLEALALHGVWKQALADQPAGVLVYTSGGSPLVYVYQVEDDLHSVEGRGWSLLFSTTARPGTLTRMLQVYLRREEHPKLPWYGDGWPEKTRSA
ncbi:hypothetical protein [Deinococcus sp. QL22]|uniref:hypothetical protein n=1 Tax=Deinococcus sp. QL22 TaxID=2939437 RepID=UPI002016E5E9|nr:hypothetical protein [Deinococcus sp. QL22]UQN09458.1 hypothetical protein M1R55_23165 [Deinococcus sp. QL22]